MSKNKSTKSNKISKKQIPSALRNSVWNTYMGPYTHGSCMCCSREKISVFNWICGHIISVKNNGPNTVNNLRPICGNCNSSMGTQNMMEFMDRCGFVKPDNWSGFMDSSDISDSSDSSTISTSVDTSSDGITYMTLYRKMMNDQIN